MGLTDYQVLEVTPNASPEVIEAAYQARVKTLRNMKPRDQDAEARLIQAYVLLSQPETRAVYDETLLLEADNIIGDRYRVLRVIGSGGFGTTYLAEHIELPGSRVCIKHGSKISPESDLVLSREAQAMWDLRHHAIPPIRDYLRLPDGSVALVMGYIEGPTLHDLVVEKGPIVPEDVCWIAERMLNALKYLHYSGVVNGDVKPKNTIIQPDTHAVALVDFGISAIRPGANDTSFGYTPYFGPPEGNPKFNKPLIPESDFYSLGATMIFALTGDLNAVSNRRVPRSVPAKIAEFIHRLTQLNPVERPAWKDEDLIDTIVDIRETCFGRRRSGLKTIQHTHPTEL